MNWSNDNQNRLEGQNFGFLDFKTAFEILIYKHFSSVFSKFIVISKFGF